MRPAWVALALWSCARPWNTDESRRIDDVMGRATPVAREEPPPSALLLGADAPKLAAPPAQARAAYQGRRPYGRGYPPGSSSGRSASTTRTKASTSTRPKASAASPSPNRRHGAQSVPPRQ